jgi:hypothetical protein
MEGIDAKQSEITQTNFHQIMATLKKQINLLSLLGWSKWRDSSKMMQKVSMMSTYAQSKCQPNTRQKRLLGCFSERLLKNLNLKTDTLGYHLTVLHTHDQVEKWSSQILWSPFPHLPHGGEEGAANKREGFSGPKDEPDTDGPNHSIYKSGFSWNVVSEWMCVINMRSITVYL